MMHRFAVDKMLGRLATWLRIIGQDASYGAHLSGLALLRHARSEGRTVLTRDAHLHRLRANVPLLYIESDHFRVQLLQVIHAFEIDPLADAFTRCARCNQPVESVPKAALADKVPPYVFATQRDFVRCPQCGRVYWPATHHELVLNELRALAHP